MRPQTQAVRPVVFTSEETAAMTSELQRYFRDELDHKLGDLPARLLVDFLSQNIGPYFYNRGLYDAQAVLAAKAGDIAEAILALERSQPRG